jgi:hypothetical protein
MKNKKNKIKHKSKQTKYLKENDNIISLNGPVNYYKLSNGSSKINIFMDFHAPINRQRKCEDYESKDIDKYFNKILSNENEIEDKTLDFFLEINPTSINYKYKYYTNDNYLSSIRKMFSKLYKEKYSNIEEEEMPKQKIRLHYMDIRDYSSFNDLKKRMEIILSELDRTRLDNLKLIIDELLLIKNILLFIDSMINSIITPNKNTMYESFLNKKIDFVNLTERLSPKNNDKINITNNDSDTDNVKENNKMQNTPMAINVVMDVGLYQILQKILSNYNDSENKDNIINFFNEHYINTSKYLIKKIDELLPTIIDIDKIIDDYIVEERVTFQEINPGKKDGSRDILPYYFYSLDKYKKIWIELTEQIEEINHLIIKMGVIMTDCYFLRRLIDNSNINNSIVYTGAYHSIIYIWFLVKFCDYNIDDYYYLRKDITKDKLIHLIKKSDYLDIIQYIIPEKVNQCIKIKKI